MKRVKNKDLSKVKSLEFECPGHTHWVPQRHLPLTHATEAGTEDLAIGHEHRPDRPGALMRLLLLLQVEQSWRCYRRSVGLFTTLRVDTELLIMSTKTI